jgi:gluconate 2-dehydrogenase gamma chain
VESLANVEAHVQAEHGIRFVQLSDDQQDAVLNEMEEGRALDGAFFRLVLAHTLEGMFCDPRWGGNKDFVGWKLIDYPGPRYVWQESDQELDVVIEPAFGSGIDPSQDFVAR